VTSPYVRRLRLGAAIRDLRRDAGFTADDLGRKIGQGRIVVSRLETGARRPDVGHVLKILDALGIGEGTEQYRTLVRVARDAAERGWWESGEYTGMGERQARTADVEHGAATIREYQVSLLPGLVQTEDFARHRAHVALEEGSTLDLEATIRGRLRRQRQITDPDGSNYELVVEEQAIRRLAVPPTVMQAQLHHLLDLTTKANISVRVLPVDARLEGMRLPRSPFALYTYPDPGDPTVAVVDTVTEDLLVIDADESGRYVRLFDRLHTAALSDDDSAALIQQVAGTPAA
jgi:transcriptional regulator with XRE-family HTH domain